MASEVSVYSDNKEEIMKNIFTSIGLILLMK